MEKCRIRKKTIVIIILALIVFSNSYLVAKYTSSLSGSNSTSIAKWSVAYDTSDNASDTLNLVSGDGAKEYIIKVTSTSEVAAKYSIILTNVPSEMEVKIDDKNYQLPDNNVVEFNNVGTFSGEDMNTTFTHILSFNAPLESTIANTTNVGINIKFEQID